MGQNILSYHAWTGNKWARKGRAWRDGSPGEEEQPPPPPPPPAAILWGAQSQQLGGENARQAMVRVEKALGRGTPARMDVFRFFHPLNANGPVWPTVMNPLEGRGFVYSARVDPITAANGSHDTKMRNFCTQAVAYLNSPEGADATIYVAVNHEPEREIQSGQYTAVQFRNTQSRLANILHNEFPHPRLKFVLILMKYTLDAASGRNFDNYFVAAAHDVLCFDVYKFKPSDSISFMIDPIVTKAKAVGKPWAIAETGVDPIADVTPNGHNPTQRAAALTALADYLSKRNPRPLFVTYFNSDRNVPGDVHNWSIADEPTMAAAWKAGMS